MSFLRRRAAAALAAAAFLVTAPASAQEPPTLTPADYDRWESLGSFEPDPTGRWIAVPIRRVDETRELRLHRTDGTGEPVVLEHASGGEFSADGRWFAYRKGVSPEEEDAAEEPVRDRLGLVDLTTRTDTVLFEVRSFAFRDDGAWLAALGHAPADTVGADLIVMRPGSDTHTLLGNVEQYAWQDEGSLLAVTLRTAWGDANGVTLHDPERGTLRSLDSRDARYRELTWRDGSAQLAVLRSVESEDREEDSHDVLVWDDVTTPGAAHVLGALGRADLPDSLRVTEHRGIVFDAEGGTVFVGLRPWKLAEPGGGDEEMDAGAATDAPADSADTDGGDAADDEDEVEPSDVQVWHWDDDDIIRYQEYSASRLARATNLAAWHLDEDRLVRLGRDLDEDVRLLEGGRWGVVPDYTPYLFERRFGAGTTDWYRVDPRTGERTLLLEGAQFGVETGTSFRMVLFYHDDRWTTVDLATLERTALDRGDGASFTRSLFDYDYPGPRRSWGVGGWEEEGAAVFLYDKHDVWRADLDEGALQRLTRGAEEGLRYRMANVDPEAFFFEPPEVPAGEPVWLSVRDPDSKASGYARVDQPGRVETLIMEDALVQGLKKVGDTERYALRMERWDDAPDVFTVGEALDGLVQVTNTNPFQEEYAWGRSELVSYTTDAGHDLQGVLIYPADFQEGERYPLILYQYERLSDNLHRYDVPSERDYYDYQTWSQQGYVVLMPDIVYEPGRPGPSALDAVEHALDAAVATGHVDPDRMGLIGHSWGGYQASYLPTRTHRFAASVAGAAITDFVSFMGAVHWNGGLAETGHWETGQARMAVPYWEDPEGHLESSPVNFIDELETPVLLMHGDADGVVDFRQGLEYYNYARRAGKEVVLLVYPGADHGLRKESNQVDYHRRILKWFGHFLKGEEAPDWIVEGESWVEREERIGR